MLDGLKFWGINLDLIFIYPYNIASVIILLAVFYLLSKRFIFILKCGELERNLIKFPGLAEIRTQLGDLYFNNNNLSRAKIFYMQALDMHPDLHYARIKLAEIYFISREDQKAIEQLTELLKRTSEEKFKYSVKVTLEKWNVDRETVHKILQS
jgi:tetratricopeptide (TPR) repeat protein